MLLCPLFLFLTFSFLFLQWDADELECHVEVKFGGRKEKEGTGGLSEFFNVQSDTWPVLSHISHCFFLQQGYQLKCDHNQELVGTNTVRCNIDAGPLSSEIDFECPVDSNCQVRKRAGNLFLLFSCLFFHCFKCLMISFQGP